MFLSDEVWFHKVLSEISWDLWTGFLLVPGSLMVLSRFKTFDSSLTFLDIWILNCYKNLKLRKKKSRIWNRYIQEPIEERISAIASQVFIAAIFFSRSEWTEQVEDFCRHHHDLDLDCPGAEINPHDAAHRAHKRLLSKKGENNEQQKANTRRSSEEENGLNSHNLIESSDYYSSGNEM